jgi:subtilisin family serine protease
LVYTLVRQTVSKTYIRDQIRQRGKASVLVMLNSETTAENYLARVADCFEHSEQHQVLASAAVGRGHIYRKHDHPPALYLKNLGVVYGQVSKAGYEKLQGALEASDDIAGTAPMRPIRGLGSTATAPTAPQVAWGVARINAPALWQQGLSGKGVLVAHLDTGVDGEHPALKPAIQQFAEFDATGHAIDGAPMEDSADHGSHTAGIIAGRQFLGQQIGVAPACQLVSAAVIEGGDQVARVLAGVDWMLNFPVRVLNLSLGFPGYFDQYIPLLKKLLAKGILPVFAIGNEGPGTSRSPANYPQALSVGAVDAHGMVDPSSGSESFPRKINPLVPDLVMPGIDIISANAGEANFRLDSGTSMAAPHLSGLAALLFEACPAATVDQMQMAICQSCSLAQSMTKERANLGMPDGPKALSALRKMVAAVKTSAAG